MLDPGTCLAIVSLALQVSNSLMGYHEVWTQADEDVAEIQRSLLALSNIFAQLNITLRKPSLSEDIVSIIRITMKGCEDNVKKLEEQLDRVKREGSPEKLRAKFTNLNRRVLQMFHQGDIKRIQAVLNGLREDLNLVINLLGLYEIIHHAYVIMNFPNLDSRNTAASSLDDLRKLHVKPKSKRMAWLVNGLLLEL
ncbi:Fc.00g044960.m01.CDS01 [Cosmosporella sp. VM-42]